MPHPRLPLVRAIIRAALLLAACLSPLCAAPALCASFQDPGHLPGGYDSEAWGLSPDASVVVGNDYDGLSYTAYRWTLATGMVGLGTLGGADSKAYAVSADGLVVVGASENLAGDTLAFRWTSGTGMVSLGVLAGGSNSCANGASADGAVVVGASDTAVGTLAFVWTAGTGMVSLGDLTGAVNDSCAYGVSADGTVIAGYGTNLGLAHEAVRWVNGVISGLGTLGGVFSEAWAVSADGSTIVGVSATATLGDMEAFRWTSGTGMVSLGDLAGGIVFSHAMAVSADGSVITGYGTSASGQEAMRWTASEGMVSLKDYLTARGVNLTGWDLLMGTGVSADGETIVGLSIDPSGFSTAFIARTTGLTTLDSLAESLAAMTPASTLVSSMGLSTLSLLGEASRGALRSAAPGLSGGEAPARRRQFWVLGRAASDGSFAGSDLGGEGGAGLTWHLGQGLSVGAGVLAGRRSLDTAHGGDQSVNLMGPAGFLAYAPEDSGLRLELLATVALADLDLGRGYLNGSGTAVSRGQTQGRVLGLSSRLGWDLPEVAGVVFQPFAQYTWQFLDLDNYSEDSGPFPAHFHRRQEQVNRSRLGLEARHAWSPDLDLWTWAAWNHRFEDRSTALSGTLTGISAFDFSGARVDKDWADAGLGAGWRPRPGLETFSRLGFGIDSDDHAEPDLSLTLGLAWDI